MSAILFHEVGVRFPSEQGGETKGLYILAIPESKMPTGIDSSAIPQDPLKYINFLQRHGAVYQDRPDGKKTIPAYRSYRADGTLCEARYYDNDVLVAREEFDDRSRLSRRESFFDGGLEWPKEYADFNPETGKVVCKAVYDKAGREQVYRYDDKGRLHDADTDNCAFEIIYRSSFTEVMEYYTHGKRNDPSDGQPAVTIMANAPKGHYLYFAHYSNDRLTNNNGCTAVKIIWDCGDFGQQLVVSMDYKDGVPHDPKKGRAAICVYHLESVKQILEIHYCDGELHNRVKDGASIIEYDPKTGAIKRQHFYDKGNFVKAVDAKGRNIIGNPGIPNIAAVMGSRINPALKRILNRLPALQPRMSKHETFKSMPQEMLTHHVVAGRAGR